MLALSKAKAKAVRIKCVSNMRQIGLAVMSYSGDNGDRLKVRLSQAMQRERAVIRRVRDLRHRRV
jgi:hypothetical protein